MTHAGASAPVFLIGTGRCGSSLLLQLLGYHPAFSWQSHWTSWLPGGGRWAFTQRIHDLPGAWRLAVNPASRAIPQPTESYRLLRAATDGLFTAPRELRAEELTPVAAAKLHELVARHNQASARHRFLLKHTGFPRVAYLRAAFPDARFIHVVRDGRAVASSLCKVDWWSGEGQWGWGPLDRADRALYAESGHHEIVLAGLYWKVLMAEYARARAETPSEALLEIRYDALVRRPVDTLRQILTFLDMPEHARLWERLAETPLMDEDDRWRRALTQDEVGWLERALGPALAAHGFAG
jgi:hypothetical protein